MRNEINNIVTDVKDKYIQVDGLDRFQEILSKITVSDRESDLLRHARKVIAKALRQARAEGITKIGAMIPNNQRHAEKAVRTRQYSKRSEVLGGNITILRGRFRSGGGSSTRLPPPTKSGRKREWSTRTKQMYGYTGEDAQFLLYWLSQGTADRQSGVGRRNRRTGEYGTRSTSDARRKYFNNDHFVGRIQPNTISPDLHAILQRVVNGELIPGLDKIIADLAKQK